MGSASPPVRPISPTITDAIQALLKSAAKSGVTIINVTEEAARLRRAIPDCELSEDEIAAAIERLSVQHSFLGLVLGRNNA